MNQQYQRAAFEASQIQHAMDAGYDESYVDLSRDGDGYAVSHTQSCWHGWQAAIAHQLLQRGKQWNAATEYLKRYQAWRTGEDDRTMDEAGITPSEVTAALNVVLSYE